MKVNVGPAKKAWSPPKLSRMQAGGAEGNTGTGGQQGNGKS